MQRLYIVVRQDLDAGLLTAQACHVTRRFTREHPEVEVPEDENLLVLAAKNEPGLVDVLDLLRSRDTLASLSTFHEPDLDGSLTAIAAVGPAVAKLLSSYPRALRPGPVAAVPTAVEPPAVPAKQKRRFLFWARLRREAHQYFL